MADKPNIYTALSVTHDNAAEVFANTIMDLVEFLDSFPRESKEIDPRVWSYLRTYMPKIEFHPLEVEEALKVFEATACKQTYDMRGGVEAVVRMIETSRVTESWTAAETYRLAITRSVKVSPYHLTPARFWKMLSGMVLRNTGTGSPRSVTKR